MLKSYFTIAIRHLMKHKLFSMLNIFCLAIGLTFSMLIGIYIIHENAVNSNIGDHENQYVIKSKWKQELMGFDITTLAPLARTVKDQYPNLVKNYYRFFTQKMAVTAGDNKKLKENVTFCDTTLVRMFDFPLLHGTKYAAFANLQSAVVTESFALRYFGETNVVGKEVKMVATESRLETELDFVISAVMKDIGENSVTDFYDSKTPSQIFVPYEHSEMGVSSLQDWSLNNIASIIELKPGVKPDDLKLPLADILRINVPTLYKDNVEVKLVNIKDFYKQENNGKVERLIRTLSYIAIFILVIAIINFINIMIGTSGYRLKEIGLRKVFGGRRPQLVVQYLCESFALTMISAIISLVVFELSRPIFFQLLATQLPHVWEFGGYEIGFLASLIILTGVVSGIYPALVLSKSNIQNAVKGKADGVKDGILLKKSLLVIQFTITIIVFIAALNISRQITYFLNKDLGYDKNGLLIISSLPNNPDSSTSFLSKIEAFRDELPAVPNVVSATTSYEIPDGDYVDMLNLIPEGSADNQVLSVPYLCTDQHYAETYGLHLKEGRFLDHKEVGDSLNEIVLNEAAVKAFGWKSGVGKKVKLALAGFWVTVVGVVNDFNFFSLHKKMSPLAFANINAFRRYRYISVRFHTNNVSNMVSSISRKWADFFPQDPISFSFMDDKLKALYTSELQLKTAVTIATIMNMVIVFLSIFGMLTSALHKRSKEMAMRKVLGADVVSITGIFIREYGLLILLANLVAWPLAYLITAKWLEDYAYHITQNAIPYLAVGLLIFIATSVLIIAKCYKVASSIMIKNLRAE